MDKGVEKIGPYQILETLHSGPQPLYRARGEDGKEVAVKTIPAAGLADEMRERFNREAETCRTLDHPNLVRVLDAGEADGMLYQAMELLEGADLGKVFAMGRRFTWDEKLSIMEQVCEGLEYAHERRLVHRDIKPANLFLENSGRVRVVDFGMVKVEESQLTKVGSSLGTLNYMSPEQIRGESCTASSDVFSAGIVFYQLATGRHPFSRKDRSLPQVVSAIVFETPAKLSELCADAPEGLEFILNKAMEKDAAKRLQNAGDLKQALSLCRITMKLGGAAATGAAPAAQDPAKTKVFRSPVAAAQPAPAAEDPEKTKVMRRQAPAAPSVPVAPAAAPVSKQAAAPRLAAEGAAPGFRYCATCTSPNPPTATVCKRCGSPLTVEKAPVSPQKRMDLGLYVAIGTAVLLAIALVVVLMVKK